MASKKLVIVPIYWGSKWLPSSDPRMQPLHPESAITWINMNSAMWTIMRSWYMLGLQDYGVLPGLVHPGYIIKDSEAVPPQTFTNDPQGAAWTTIDAVIDASQVPPPDAWGPDYKALYALLFEPGCANTDPNLFGYNDKARLHVWVTANSDLAGAIEFFAHEMVEASSGQEIADPCQPNTVVIDGLRLPLYRSQTLNACWPTEEAILLHRGFEKIGRFKDLQKNPVKIGG